MSFRIARLSYRDRLLLITGVWLIVVGAGFLTLKNYESTPGRAATPVASWPVERRVSLDPSRATLVMLAHPHCPCTRASIESLSQIMTRCQGLVTAHIVFYKPAGFPQDWEKTDQWYSAAAIPGVAVLCDEQGHVARSFGAKTSGQVLLYSPVGELLFSGGITDSRGHAGDNAGRDAVIACLTGHAAASTHTPVFGCPIQTPTEPGNEGDTP
jgi:hypothetical protein